MAKKKAAKPKANPPGVNADGVLVDPQSYFWWLIQRSPGQSAQDWVQVLESSGIPEGYPPYVVPTDNGFYGLTQQIGAGGVRGRLFLPTAEPDPLGFYSHPIDLLDNAFGGDCSKEPRFCTWAWKDQGGPAYAPVTPDGGGTEPPDGGGGEEPPPPGLTREEVQAMIDAAMEKAVQYGQKIALQSSGEVGPEQGKLLCAERGGPKLDNQPFELTSRSGMPGPWESWMVRKGQ